MESFSCPPLLPGTPHDASRAAFYMRRLAKTFKLLAVFSAELNYCAELLEARIPGGGFDKPQDIEAVSRVERDIVCRSIPTLPPFASLTPRTTSSAPAAVSYTHLTLPTNREV